MINPCNRDCKERHPGCSIDCEKRRAWLDYIEPELAKARRRSLLNAYVARSVVQVQKKHAFKRRHRV